MAEKSPTRFWLNEWRPPALKLIKQRRRRLDCYCARELLIVKLKNSACHRSRSINRWKFAASINNKMTGVNIITLFCGLLRVLVHIRAARTNNKRPFSKEPDKYFRSEIAATDKFNPSPFFRKKEERKKKKINCVHDERVVWKGNRREEEKNTL